MDNTHEVPAIESEAGCRQLTLAIAQAALEDMHFSRARDQAGGMGGNVTPRGAAHQ